MPRPSVKEERTEEILDAFERCVARYGVEGSTLERIAEAAGLRRSLLRHYVGNREDLLAALIDRFLERSEQENAELFEALTAKDSASQLVDYLFDEDYIDTHAVQVADALIAASAHRPELAPRVRDWIEDFTGRIAKELGRSYPDSRARDRRQVAAGLVGIYFTVDSLTPIGPMPGLRRDSKAAAKRLLRTLEPQGR